MLFYYNILATQPQNSYSEESLIQGLKCNSRKAYAELYDRFSNSLFAVIYEITKDRDEAENLLQDTFIKIWKNIERYDASKARLYTWMVIIARRIALDFIKSSYNVEKKKIQNDEILVHTQISHIETKHEYDIGIQKSIADLEENQRLMIELQYVKGYTQQEVADETGIPLGTVKSRTRSALLTLRKKLENEDI